MSSILTPGQVFAERYRVVRFLAGGGMGSVFECVHLTTELRVALKVLRPEVLGTAAAKERFELEAKVAARVKSDHIVKVLDAGTEASTGLPFLVMELLEGHPLEQLVLERGPIAPRRLLPLLEQVANGLERAHGYVDPEGVARPIVHRDLKPENLFVVQPDSPNPVVKILDFGIAKVLSDTAKVSQELRGTPLYMAYEQATGRGVSPQTDIWALGLIAFFCLTGRPYWRSAAQAEGTIESLLAEILTLPTPPASERTRELGATDALPPAFDAWLARCIDRQPEMRFASAQQAVDELSRVFERGAFDQTIPSADLPAFPSIPGGSVRVAGATTGQLSVATKESTAPGKGRWLPWGGLVILAGAAVGSWLWVSKETAQPTSSAPPEAPSTTALGSLALPGAASSAAAPRVEFVDAPRPAANPVATASAAEPTATAPAPAPEPPAPSRPGRPAARPPTKKPAPSAKPDEPVRAKTGDDPYDLR